MNDFVSQRTGVAVLTLSIWVVYGAFFPAFPWSGLLWAGSAVAVSLFLLRPEPIRTTAQVIRDVEGEQYASTTPMRVVTPAPTRPCDR